MSSTEPSAKPPIARMPSLNQLAARMSNHHSNNNSVPSGSSPTATRPRLAPFGSAAEQTSGRRIVKGYKNIPSLEDITARLSMSRTLSVDGTAKPPEPEPIEDPKSPGVHVMPPEHPLQYQWTIYHDTKAKFPFTPSSATDSHLHSHGHTHASDSTTDYEANLIVVGTFSTVEQYCRYFNWLKPPSNLDRNSNYHLFKAGIKPMWEDAANAGGGKWVLTMKNNPALLDRCWSWLTMALVGEELEDGIGDEICGAVVSLRTKVDRIQLWTRGKEDVERLNKIGKKLVKILDVSEDDGIGLEFQYNTEDRPLPNKFLSIQSVPSTSTYRSSTFHSDRERDKDSHNGPVSASSSGPVNGVGGGESNVGGASTTPVSASSSSAPGLGAGPQAWKSARLMQQQKVVAGDR